MGKRLAIASWIRLLAFIHTTLKILYELWGSGERTISHTQSRSENRGDGYVGRVDLGGCIRFPLGGCVLLYCIHPLAARNVIWK